MSWYLTVLKKYAVFSGRARRKEFWMFFLINLIIGFVLSFVGFFSVIGTVLYDLYLLAVLLPSLAVSVRRLHDTNHSGWWSLSPAVSVPLVLIGLVGAFITPLMLIVLGIGVLSLIAIQIALLILYVRDSQPGENRYGPNPKQVEQVS